MVYPAVLLPTESEEWPEERQRVVLVHEMAHVKRFDALTQLLAQLAIAVFWFDPLVWLAARRMRAEREHACDDYVLRDGTRPSSYANELLDMVRRIADRAGEAGAPAFAALAMARRSEFEGRMVAILDPGADRHALSRAASVVGVLVALVLLAPLAAVHPIEERVAIGGVAHAGTRVLTMPAGRGRAAAYDVAATVRMPEPPSAPAPIAAPAPVAVAAAAVGGIPAPQSAQAQERLPIIYKCTRGDLRTSNTTYAVHTDDKFGDFVERYAKTYGRCLHVVLAGRVTFTPDERDIASLSPNGHVQLHERTFESDRSLMVMRDPDGRLRRTYMVDGRPAAFDASAQAWVARVVQDLARESGADVGTRVSRIRARRGVKGVLEEIGEIQSSDAKRKHYQALLAGVGGELSAGDVDLVVRHAGKELSGSSGDLRAVLRQVPPSGLRTVNTALEGAIGRMSDGDKQTVLSSMLDSADTPTLLVVLRLAQQIGSDGDKAAFLQRAAPRVLGSSNPSLREAFFRTYATIGSDGDKHSVLVAALRKGYKSPPLTRDVIRGATRIGSDGEKASVLLAVARDRLLTTEELRGEYIKAARTIGSDGEYRSVIDALLGGKSGG